MAHLRQILLAMLLILTLAACAPLYFRSRPVELRSGQLYNLRPRSACSIQGNPDFYGLGIRVGIYLQWVSSFLANHLLKDSIDSNLSTNTIFLLALFVAMVVANFQGSVQPAEVVILLQLCFGFLFSILSIWGLRTRVRPRESPVRFPLLGAAFRLTIATAVTVYAAWFWIHESGQSPDAGRCSNYIFLFGKLDIHGPIRIFFSIQSMVILVVYCVLFLNELLMLTCFLASTIAWATTFSACVVMLHAPHIYFGIVPDEVDFRSLATKKKILISIRIAVKMSKQVFAYAAAISWKRINGTESAGANRPKLHNQVFLFINTCVLHGRTWLQLWCLGLFAKAPPINVPPLLNIRAWLTLRKMTFWTNTINEAPPYVRIPLRTCNAFCILWAIISVEVTLVWNRIDGVYDLRSTGQLIPFIIGIVSLIQLAHDLSVHRSAVTVTDVLLKLFDVAEVSDDAVKLERMQTPSNTNNASTDRRFPSRKIERRNSFNIPPTRIELMSANRRNSKADNLDSPSPCYHLQHRFNAKQLRKVYGRDNVVEHKISNGKCFWIVSDFTRTSARSSSRGRPLERRNRTERHVSQTFRAASYLRTGSNLSSCLSTASDPLRRRKSLPDMRSFTTMLYVDDAVFADRKGEQRNLSECSDSDNIYMERKWWQQRKPLRRLCAHVFRYFGRRLRFASRVYLQKVAKHVKRRSDVIEYWLKRVAHTVLDIFEQAFVDVRAGWSDEKEMERLMQDFVLHLPERTQALSHDMGLSQKDVSAWRFICRLWTVKKTGAATGDWNDLLEHGKRVYGKLRPQRPNDLKERSGSRSSEISVKQPTEISVRAADCHNEQPILGKEKHALIKSTSTDAYSRKDVEHQAPSSTSAVPDKPLRLSPAGKGFLSTAELMPLYRFDFHKRHCSNCISRFGRRRNPNDLCTLWHELLEDIAAEMYSRDGNIYSTTIKDGTMAQLELPTQYEYVKDYLEVMWLGVLPASARERASRRLRRIRTRNSPSRQASVGGRPRSRLPSHARLSRSRSVAIADDQDEELISPKNSRTATDLERERKKMRGKELISTGLATVAAIHAMHGVYSSMEAHEKRIRLVSEGKMTPEEARKQQTKNWVQDSAAVGIAIFGFVHGSRSAARKNASKYENILQNSMVWRPGDGVAMFASLVGAVVLVGGCKTVDDRVQRRFAERRDLSSDGTTSIRSSRSSHSCRHESSRSRSRPTSRSRSCRSGRSRSRGSRRSCSRSTSNESHRSRSGSTRTRSNSCSTNNISSSTSCSHSRDRSQHGIRKLLHRFVQYSRQQSVIALGLRMVLPLVGDRCEAWGFERVGGRVERLREFLHLAKMIRVEQSKGKIGKTAQHEKVVEGWASLVGDDWLLGSIRDLWDDIESDGSAYEPNVRD